MTNEWIPNPGTGDNPVREGEKLVALRFQYGHEYIPVCSADKWEWKAGDITHFKVSPPRTATPTAEPATMSADEVLIRAREAAIEGSALGDADADAHLADRLRRAMLDKADMIKAIVAFHRDLSKPLDEVAPHTVEDPDDRVAYDLYAKQCGVNLHPWEDRHASSWYRSILAGIKRGRELERGA